MLIASGAKGCVPNMAKRNGQMMLDDGEENSFSLTP